MNKKIAETLAAAAMLGLGAGVAPPPFMPFSRPIGPPFINDFGKVDLQAAKLWQKAKLRPRLFWSGAPYKRPKTGNEIKGKLNIKFAKKQKVKTLKLSQGII